MNCPDPTWRRRLCPLSAEGIRAKGLCGVRGRRYAGHYGAFRTKMKGESQSLLIYLCKQRFTMLIYVRPGQVDSVIWID